MAKVETDMLHGPLLGKIVMFALPYAATGILQQLFNSINVFVVGRFDSSHAMAAVGATTFLINLIINLFLGVSVGANAVIANNIGRRDPQAVHRAVSTTAALSLIGGAILLVVGLLVATPLLRLLGTPADVIHDSALYLNICFLGAPFFMVYNFGAAIFRSKGDTRTPLYILAVAGVINVVVSMVTVIVFHMSVAGVACAYFVSNMFSAVVITTLLWREKGEFRVRLRQIRIYRKELGDILSIGLPAGLQATVFSFSNVFVQSSINKFGYAAIAGASLSITFDTYCYYVLTAFCATAITFTGQNYGAGQVDRCRRIFRLCFLLGGASILRPTWCLCCLVLPSPPSSPPTHKSSITARRASTWRLPSSGSPPVMRYRRRACAAWENRWLQPCLPSLAPVSSVWAGYSLCCPIGMATSISCFATPSRGSSRASL